MVPEAIVAHGERSYRVRPPRRRAQISLRSASPQTTSQVFIRDIRLSRSRLTSALAICLKGSTSLGLPLRLNPCVKLKRILRLRCTQQSHAVLAVVSIVPVLIGM